MNASRLLAGLLGSLFMAGTTLGADDEGAIEMTTQLESEHAAFEEATGFIVDRTITNFGALFVREFAQGWRAQVGTAGVDLTISEKPSARWGSTIFVEYNNQPLARVFLQAGSSAAIKPLALDTARYLAGRVADNALLNLLTADPDLAREELP